MNFNLRLLVAAAAVATASTSAFAYEAFPQPKPLNGFGVPGGKPAPVFVEAKAFNPATFSYSFTLNSATGFSDLAGALSFWDPVDLKVSLTGPSFSETVNVAGSFNIDQEFGFDSLANGAYVISFTGLATSSSSSIGGGYITLSVAAVPEPQSIAMVLAGLGIAGVLVRRRKG